MMAPIFRGSRFPRPSSPHQAQSAERTQSPLARIAPRTPPQQAPAHAPNEPIRPASFAQKTKGDVALFQVENRTTFGQRVLLITDAQPSRWFSKADHWTVLDTIEGGAALDDRSSNRRRLVAMRCEPNTARLGNKRSRCPPQCSLTIRTPKTFYPLSSKLGDRHQR